MFPKKQTVNNFFLILCIIGFFAILSSTMAKNPVLKPFATSLDTPNDLVGFVASASTIPGILISFPAASLSDVVGRRKFLLLATFVFASAPFLYLIINVWWQLVLVRFYHGFATAIFVPVAEAIMVDYFPEKRGERISLFSSATAAGRALAPFMGGTILVLTANSFHSLYIAVTIAGCTAFLVAVFLKIESKKPNVPPERVDNLSKRLFQGWSTLVTNRGVLIVSLIQASQYYVFGTVEFFLVGYLVEVVRLNLFSVGVITGSQIVALIIARPLIGRISDRVGRRIPIILGSLISCILLLFFPFMTQFPILLLLSVGYGISFATVISSTSPLVSELVPQRLIGSSLGFLSTIMDVGQTAGPIISGLILASSLHYVGLFSSLSVILLFSCSIFALSKPRKIDTDSILKKHDS